MALFYKFGEVEGVDFRNLFRCLSPLMSVSCRRGSFGIDDACAAGWAAVHPHLMLGRGLSFNAKCRTVSASTCSASFVR